MWSLYTTHSFWSFVKHINLHCNINGAICNMSKKDYTDMTVAGILARSTYACVMVKIVFTKQGALSFPSSLPSPLISPLSIEQNSNYACMMLFIKLSYKYLHLSTNSFFMKEKVRLYRENLRN